MMLLGGGATGVIRVSHSTPDCNSTVYVVVKHPNRHVYANKFCLRSRSVRISEEYFTPTSSVKSVSTWRPHAHTGSIFCTSDHRSWYPPVEQNEKKIDFYLRYHVPPTITCGLTGLDIDHDNCIHIKAIFGGTVSTSTFDG